MGSGRNNFESGGGGHRQSHGGRREGYFPRVNRPPPPKRQLSAGRTPGQSPSPPETGNQVCGECNKRWRAFCYPFAAFEWRPRLSMVISFAFRWGD